MTQTKLPSFTSSSSVSDFETVALQHRAEFQDKIDKPAELIKPVKEKSYGSVSRSHSTTGNPYVFHMESEVDLAPSTVAKLFHSQSPYRPIFDSMIDKAQVIQVVGDNMLVVRHMMKSQLLGVVKARDSVDLVQFHILEDGTFEAIAASIEHADCPAQDGYVRVNTFPQGIRFSPTSSPNVTRHTSIFDVELRLPIFPQAVVDAFVPTTALKFMEGMRQPIKYNVDDLKLVGWTS